MHELDQYPVIFEQKVAWGDMDAFGHVNNVIYYRYMESARICYFDQLNIFASGASMVVASNNCKYLSAVFHPDVLKIGARTVEIRNSALRMEYILYSVRQNQTIARGEAVIVFVDKNEMKKTLISDQIKKDIIQLERSVNNFII